jgi:eukaryotic-like serine/threonine-protein kinase
MSEQTKYRVLHELGAGGMGLVWKGQLVGQAGFLRPLVIKQLRHANDPGHVQLFVDEARRYALLDHENIGRIFDFERVEGELCIILEYIDGWTLVDYLRRHRERGLSPDVDLSVFIASRVCRALQYVFERAAIVHRDISPSNIMMTREGTVKLIDFGIATRSGTRDQALTGKPAYMAPEMVLELRADNRSDLFSLGAVLFELLTGRRLFAGETTTEVLQSVIASRVPSPRDENPEVPDAVTGILRRALQPEPADRFASAAEMGEACEHYLYDKGYGPTNLTLKRYVSGLFPEAAAEMIVPEEGFVRVEPTLLPITEGRRSRPPVQTDGETAVAPVSRAYTRVVAQRPLAKAGSATVPATPPSPAPSAVVTRAVSRIASKVPARSRRPAKPTSRRRS